MGVVYQKLKVGHLVQQKGALGIVALSSFKIAGGLSELLGAHGIDLNLNHLWQKISPFLHMLVVLSQSFNGH